MSELIPCPFCGSSDVYIYGYPEWVRCRACTAVAHLKVWNTRVPDPALDELETWLEVVQAGMSDPRHGDDFGDGMLLGVEKTLVKLRELKSK